MSPTSLKSSLKPEDFAGFWIRVCAFAVDALILAIPQLMIRVAAGVFFDPKHQPLQMLLTQSFFNFFLVTLPYLGFLQAYLEGTLGKKLFGLATVSEDGGKLSAGQAFSRVFVSNFSAFFFCLGYIWVGFQPQKQGWHDLAARSVVVHKRALAQWRNTPQDQVTSQAA